MSIITTAVKMDARLYGDQRQLKAQPPWRRRWASSVEDRACYGRLVGNCETTAGVSALRFRVNSARSRCLRNVGLASDSGSITGRSERREGSERDITSMKRHQLSAAVCTGSSQRAVNLSSRSVTVIEHPAISSEVTYEPTSDRVTASPRFSKMRRAALYMR